MQGSEQDFKDQHTRRGAHKGDWKHLEEMQIESQECGITETKKIQSFKMEKLVNILSHAVKKDTNKKTTKMWSLNLMRMSIIYDGRCGFMSETQRK